MERFETFTVLINRISRNIRKIKNQEMAEYNLKSAHVSCLYYIFKAKTVILATGAKPRKLGIKGDCIAKICADSIIDSGGTLITLLHKFLHNL